MFNRPPTHGNPDSPAGGVGSDTGEADPEGSRLGKLLNPARRRACIDQVVAKHAVSERFACRVLCQHRSTQRKILTASDDEPALAADIVALALQYDRYGYRRITAMLHQSSWVVNRKRVERIWRREGLKISQKQPKFRQSSWQPAHLPDCIDARATVTVGVATPLGAKRFTTTGSVIRAPGRRAVYGREAEADVDTVPGRGKRDDDASVARLPAIDHGEEAKAAGAEVANATTEPPRRITRGELPVVIGRLIDAGHDAAEADEEPLRRSAEG